jgi:putative Ig domain-containing protein/glucodextranase-like protein
MRPLVFRKIWFLSLLLLALTASRTVSADTLTLMWDPSTDSSVAGYVVYVGTQSGQYSRTYDVGTSTAFAYPDAVAGQRYYFSVRAYSPGPILGSPSLEVSGYSNVAPVLVNPGGQSTVAGSSVTLQLSGSDSGGQTLVYGATSLPPGLNVSSSTGLISGTATTAGTFLVTAVVNDGMLSDAETFSWTVTAPATDTSAPVVSITVPTSSTTYSTEQTFVTLGGTARDNDLVTDVSWVTDRGISGYATGTDSWIAGIPLQRGPNTITVRARDEAGNVSSRAIVVKSTGGKAKK